MAEQYVVIGGDRPTAPAPTGTTVGTTDAQTISNKTFGAQALTGDGAITTTSNFVTLDKSGGAIAATLAAPVPGQFMVITQIDAGTAGHSVTLTAGTFDGTNDTATFDAAGETLVLFGVTATRFVIVENIGSVGLSAP